MTAKTKELGFITLTVAIPQLANPENAVTQFLNGAEVRSVLSVQAVYNQQFGANCQVFILYEKEPPEPSGKDGVASRATRSTQAFKKRRKPEPLH